MRTFVKSVLKAVDSGDLETAKEAYRKAVPVIDSMVNKGIIHKNNAARKKSRLNARIKSMVQSVS